MEKMVLNFLIDFLIAAEIIMCVWVVHYKVPQKIRDAGPVQSFEANRNKEAGMRNGAGMNSEDGAADNLTDWREKFADHFTDSIIVTEDSYSSPNLSVQLSFGRYTAGDQNNSQPVTYVLADVYISDITCIQTAFPQDIYGIGYSEKLLDMTLERKAVLGINGDSCTNDMNKDNGTIIRNGDVYRDEQSAAETCVLNRDGTMEIYEPYSVDAQELIRKGAYQSWVFGPSLLDENGKAKQEFYTWDYLRQAHPRTAIGYYEPGHYCFLVADGRQEGSRGMFLEEMAGLFEKLGCKAAYNLDGGHSSFMTMQDQVVSHPYDPSQEVMDGIFLFP